MSRARTNWTRLDARIREAAAAGMSATQVADEFTAQGVEVSRSAVCGRAHRIGVTWHHVQHRKAKRAATLSNDKARREAERSARKRAATEAKRAAQRLIITTPHKVGEWLPERIELLIKMVNEGASATQCAVALGVTRNTAMNKAYRLGLKFRNPTGRPRLRAPEVKPGPRNPVGNMPFTAAIPLPDMPEEAPGRCTIHTLSPFVCRWPIGDPTADDFTYCGAAKAGEGPYCEAHHARAYKPTGSVKELMRVARRYAA